MFRQMGHESLDTIERRHGSAIGATERAPESSFRWIGVLVLGRNMTLEHKLPAELYAFNKPEDSHIVPVQLPTDRHQATLKLAVFALPILCSIVHASRPHPLFYGPRLVANLLPPSTFAEAAVAVQLTW